MTHDEHDNLDKQKAKLDKQKAKLDKQKEKLNCLHTYRKLFYIKHNILEITQILMMHDITNPQLNFEDAVSVKYSVSVKGINLHTIKHLHNAQARIATYTIWHKAISKLLFGIPNDRVSCMQCAFFVKKFANYVNTDANTNASCFITEFMNATATLELDICMCDLVTFTTNGKTIYNNIPLLDITKTHNLESMELIRNIIKKSYDVKIILSRQEEHELNSINKSMNEDCETHDKPVKYITLSQMFGHYMSHVITSSYLEVDYGYALSIHKSQGSTYDNVYVEYSNILMNNKELEKNKLLYTAITRSANKLHIYY